MKEIKNNYFKSLEELNEERKRIVEKYGEIPSLVRDVFDIWEDRLKIRERNAILNRGSSEQITKLKEDEEKEFWKNNKLKVSTLKMNAPEQREKILYDEFQKDSKLKDIEIKHIIETCESRLDAFAKFYFPHYLKRPSSKFHKFLYKILPEAVEKKYKKARWAIAAPRSNAKSTLINCIFPIWCVVYGKKKFIMLISNTVNQAIDFLADIKKELEGNMRLMRDFPHACGKGIIWRAEEIITRNDIKVLALGTGSKIRGRRFGAQRPDLIICDDLEDLEMVRSEAQRNAIREWFNKDLMYAGNEADKLDIFVIGTIIGHEALLNRLTNPAIFPNWSSRVFRAVEKFSDSPLWDEWARIYKNPLDKDREQHAKEFFEQHKEEMLRGTEVLWPEGDPYYDLMIHKLTDPSGFLTEKQNQAVDLTKVKIKLEELVMVPFDNISYKFIKSLPTFAAIDPSLGKKSKSGDYSVITTMAWDKEHKTAYVLDIDMARRSVDKQISDILKLFRKFEWRMLGIETTAFQYVLAQLLRKRMKELGYFIPIKEIDSKSDKQLRIESLFPFLRDGTIVFDETQFNRNPRYREAVDQILIYTGEKGEYDDVLDSMEMCFSLIKGKKFRMLTKPAKSRRI